MKWFVVFVVYTIVCVCVCCPDGWVTHGSNCYHFSREPETWATATVMCQLMKGQLVEIESQQESTFLETQAKLFGSSFWIAATDLEKEGTWVWMNSDTNIDTQGFSDWVPGRPNNGDGQEDCSRIDKPLGYKWNDEHCEDKTKYICERENW